jgi:hypothetical protein
VLAGFVGEKKEKVGVDFGCSALLSVEVLLKRGGLVGSPGVGFAKEKVGPAGVGCG